MKEEIAKDRAERTAREKKAKAEAGATAAASQPLTTAPQAKKEYDSCRLQVCIVQISSTVIPIKQENTHIIILSLAG